MASDKTIVVSGASGFIGRHIIPVLRAKSYRVIGLGRDISKMRQLFSEDIELITWDDLKTNPQLLDNCHAIIHLAGFNIGQKRWSEKVKQDIINSRLETTQQLSEHLQHIAHPPTIFLGASGISIYGQQAIQPHNELAAGFTEDSVINQETTDFMAKLAIQWEQATKPIAQLGIRVVNMRFGVVLDKRGGALQQMSMPFKFGCGGRVGSGHQILSWISLVDLLGIIELCLTNHDISGPLNCVSPHAIKQYRFAKALGNAMKRPSIMPLPSFMVKLMFGEMGETLLLNGQHVLPKRLTELKFAYQYPDLDTFLVEQYQ